MDTQNLDPQSQQHLATWRGFGKLLLWSVIGIVIVLLLLRLLVVTPTAVVAG
jgi:hypothetical protein